MGPSVSFPLPLRIAQKLPVRDSWELINSVTDFIRVAPVQFGSVTVWGWNGSSGSGFRFPRCL